MKMRFYVDLAPGVNPQQFNLYANTQPGPKTKGWKRLAFDVQIPDQVLFDLDAISPEVSKPEVVEDHDG